MSNSPPQPSYVELAANLDTVGDGNFLPASRLPPGAVNVRWFGAKGDGSTDDTAAIAAAIASSAFTSGAPLPVYFPSGTYVTDPITTLVAGHRVGGDGQNSSILKSRTGQDVIALTGGPFHYLHLHDIAILGAGNTGNTGNGIYLHDFGADALRGLVIERVHVSMCGGYGIRIGKIGYDWTGGYSNPNTVYSSSFRDLEIEDCGLHSLSLMSCGPTTTIENLLYFRIPLGAVGLHISIGQATIISVNGQDNNITPGGGSMILGDQAGYGCTFYVLGCNFELFSGIAIKTSNLVTLTVEDSTFTTQPSGTGFAAISTLSSGVTMRNCILTLNGTATWLNGEPFHAPSSCPLFVERCGPAANQYDDARSVAIPLAQFGVKYRNDTFGVSPFFDRAYIAESYFWANSTSRVPITVEASDSQTVPLQEWLDFGGNVGLCVLATGSTISSGAGRMIVLQSDYAGGGGYNVAVRDVFLVQSFNGGQTFLNINPYAGTLAFFGASPVGQQPGGAATASGSYGATEQGMLNKVYTALRNLGLMA